MAHLIFIHDIVKVYIFYCMVIWLSNAQSTICVWNSLDTRDNYNGEYQLSSATYMNAPYWFKLELLCPLTYSYIIQINDEEPLWVLSDTLQSSYEENQPYCDGTKSNPTEYTQWLSYEKKGHQTVTLSMTVYDAECPSLQCPSIELENTGYAQCDTEFIKYNDMDNVYVNGDDVYFYFNQQTFKWYCSTYLGVDECEDDDMITHFYVSSLADGSYPDGWFDINSNAYAYLYLNNAQRAVLYCKVSTVDPTFNPSSTYVHPSSRTTTDYLSSTNPTMNPTNYPSSIIHHPTGHPSSTTTVTSYSTNDGIINPTLIPTSHPSLSATTSVSTFASLVISTYSLYSTVSTQSIYVENVTHKHQFIGVLKSMLMIGGLILFIIILCICPVYILVRCATKDRKRGIKQHAIDLQHMVQEDEEQHDNINTTETAEKTDHVPLNVAPVTLTPKGETDQSPMIDTFNKMQSTEEYYLPVHPTNDGDDIQDENPIDSDSSDSDDDYKAMYVKTQVKTQTLINTNDAVN